MFDLIYDVATVIGVIILILFAIDAVAKSEREIAELEEQERQAELERTAPRSHVRIIGYKPRRES